MPKLFLTVLILPFLLTACFSPSPKRPEIELVKYDYSRMVGWRDENIGRGFHAFLKTCEKLHSAKIQSKKLFAENKAEWARKCNDANHASSPKQFFERNFTPYLVTTNGKGSCTFTGYFQKEIEASFTKNAVYKYPIYAKPQNPILASLTRKEIDNGALNGKGLEIAYAKSAARLFFLHIQGSGILRLPDGRGVEIGYAGTNNLQYTGIGSYMLKNGLIKHGSAEEIVAWLEKNPARGKEIMQMNQRYVFFEIKPGGAYGSLGIALTEQASLAVDPAYIPLGAPMWLQTTLPVSNAYFTRLMMAQDTGSAIKGPIRGDIFFGSGHWAQHTASGMKNKGSYFMLLPNGIRPGDYF